MPLYRSPEPGTPPGGSTAQVLAKASGADFDTEWVDQSGGVVGVMPAGGSGAYLWDSKNDRGAGVTFAADGNSMLIPIAIAAAVNVNGLFMEVKTAGATGSLVRGGIYLPDGASGGPGTLVVDCGTLSSASTGNKQIWYTPTPLTAGIYWLVVVAQGGAASQPTLGAMNKDQKVPALPSTADYTNAAGQLTATGITGALPSLWVASLALGGAADGVTLALIKE